MTQPFTGLLEDEIQLLNELDRQLLEQRRFVNLTNLYYDAEQAVRDLKISTPPQLQGLHTVLGWARIFVDSIEERLDLSYFIRKGQLDPDEQCAEIWEANNLDEDAHLGHLDGLVAGHGYVVVGGIGPHGVPLITVESPRNVSVRWDAVMRRATGALVYFGQDRFRITAEPRTAMLLTDQFIVTLLMQDGGWVVVNRVPHALGVTPVRRLSNRQRSHNRLGSSEITPDIRGTIDSACRTMLGMEISREFFGAPGRYILGIDEDGFVDENGEPLDVWETYIGRLMAIPRDADGELPQVGTFSASSPDVYTTIIDTYARIMVGQTGLPAQYFGITDSQPPSADSIRMQESRLVKRAERKQAIFSPAWQDVMGMATAVSNNETYDPKTHNPNAVWVDANTRTESARGDFIQKMIASGVYAAQSSVTMELSGLTAPQIARMQADWRTQNGRDQLAALAARAATSASDPGQVATGTPNGSPNAA